MGRYYSGDIEGKFMFAVQSSTAADRFGSEGYQEYIEYYFNKEHLDEINTELALCKPSFELDDLRRPEDVGITDKELKDYADYILGDKIRDHLTAYDECRFIAEL